MEEQPIIINKTASRKRRIAGYLVDQILLSFLVASLLLLIYGGEMAFPAAGDSMGYLVMAFFVIVPSMILYFMRDFYKGISPGKWIFGTKVVTNDEEAAVPKKMDLLARNLPLVIWPVEVVVLVVSKDKRRWGDTLAKTKVIYNPNKADKMKRIAALAFVVMGMALSLFFVSTTVIRNSDAYQNATLIILKNDEIQTATGGIESFGAFPSGKISMNAEGGNADLVIVANGKNKNVDVKIILEKPTGDTSWTAKSITWE